VSRGHRNATDVPSFFGGKRSSYINSVVRVGYVLIHMFVKILGDFFSCAVLIKISKIDIRAHIENRSELSWVQVSHRKTTGMFVFMPRFAYWIYHEKITHLSPTDIAGKLLWNARQARFSTWFSIYFTLMCFDLNCFVLTRLLMLIDLFSSLSLLVAAIYTGVLKSPQSNGIKCGAKLAFSAIFIILGQANMWVVHPDRIKKHTLRHL